MNLVTPPPRRMTLAEFLAWDGEPDRHYQLIDGVAVMMAPASRPHNALVANLLVAMANAVGRESGLRVESETGIIRPERPDRWFEADLVVTAEPVTRLQFVERPILIAEVLSPSTETLDRTVKLPDYRMIPTVQEILLVGQNRACVELLRRDRGDAWLSLLAVGLDAHLRLESVPLDLPLAELYRGIPLDDDAVPDSPSRG